MDLVTRFRSRAAVLQFCDDNRNILRLHICSPLFSAKTWPITTNLPGCVSDAPRRQSVNGVAVISYEEGSTPTQGWCGRQPLEFHVTEMRKGCSGKSKTTQKFRY
jgi:hypothetical protein